MNATALVAELVGYLAPGEPLTLPHGLARALAADEPDRAAGAPHPDGWTCGALAERYRCSDSAMRGRIAGGEFGEPDTEGGPRKQGRGWLVPHAQVLARDARVNTATAPPPATTSARPALSGKDKPQTLVEKRRRGGRG